MCVFSFVVVGLVRLFYCVRLFCVDAVGPMWFFTDDLFVRFMLCGLSSFFSLSKSVFWLWTCGYDL
jgi:hypothetical protein